MSDELRIDKRFVVNLKGKDYPTWPGILDAATKAGLKSLRVELVQMPNDANGGVAICQATAEFEDGRVFSDYGDAGPKTCSPAIALACIRMASTRAKGRCLRDAVNCGMTLLEELPEEERSPARPAPRCPPAAEAEAPPAEEESEIPIACSAADCGIVLAPSEIQACIKHAPRLAGKWYCTHHGKEALAAGRQVAA